MRKNKIEPIQYITIDVYNLYNIPVIIRDKTGNILHMNNILKTGGFYNIRRNLINLIDDLLDKYEINMIILEQNQLFIDKIDRHPDPFVLRDIQLGYGIKISVDDKYHNTIKYILGLPEMEWRKQVLNSSVKYSIDLYKSHILQQSISSELLTTIEQNNYYKALCLSESIWFDRLMDKKYQINKGD